MSNPDLLQAIQRLDQAVGRAESALTHAKKAHEERHLTRDAVVRQAVAELDLLITSLRGGNNA